MNASCGIRTHEANAQELKSCSFNHSDKDALISLEKKNKDKITISFFLFYDILIFTFLNKEYLKKRVLKEKST